MLTFLGDQRLASCWQADHDHTDLRILDPDANAIRLAGAGHLHYGGFSRCMRGFKKLGKAVEKKRSNRKNEKNP